MRAEVESPPSVRLFNKCSLLSAVCQAPFQGWNPCSDVGLTWPHDEQTACLTLCCAHWGTH